MLGPIFFQQNALTYFVYLLIPIAYIVLYKTSVGLTIRSTGENPEAVDVAGIHVNTVRFLTVLTAGVLGGLRVAFFSVGYLGMFTTNMLGGEAGLRSPSPPRKLDRRGLYDGQSFWACAAVANYMPSIGGQRIFPE